MIAFLPLVACTDFFQWRLHDFLFKYGNETCTLIGSKMHISFKEEISSISFISASCPDGTLWLPEDVIAHSLDMQILEIPGNLIDCDLSDPELEVLHDYLTRLCLGPDVAGGLVLQNLLNSSHGNLQGSTVGDILAFAVNVANAGDLNGPNSDFNVTLGQGIYHEDGEAELTCIYEQGAHKAHFSFALLPDSEIKSFQIREFDSYGLLLKSFDLLKPMKFVFRGWIGVCSYIGSIMQLDLITLREILVDISARFEALKRRDTCECVLHNMFGMELMAVMQERYGVAYDMSTLWCSTFMYYAIAGPCPSNDCGYKLPHFSFAAACGSRRRPSLPSNSTAKLEAILARVRV